MYTYDHVLVNMYVHVHIYIYMCRCTHMCVRACVCVCTPYNYIILKNRLFTFTTAHLHKILSYALLALHKLTMTVALTNVPKSSQ